MHLELNVRALGERNPGLLSALTSLILISESWDFHLNLIFLMHGRELFVCFENSKSRLSLDGAGGMI